MPAMLSSKEKVWNFLNTFYEKNRITPSMSEIARGLGIGEIRTVRRAIKGLDNEGYIRITRKGNKKFFILIRSGNYL